MTSDPAETLSLNYDNGNRRSQEHGLKNIRPLKSGILGTEDRRLCTDYTNIVFNYY